ncbi:MAG: hypothetical protein DRO99_02580, partial [Candidatus Aenigmatarchaeota archaeon]
NIAGYLGKGCAFDGGADEYIDVGDSASLDITDAITISAWVRIDGTIGQSKYNPGTSCLDILEAGGSYGNGTYWIDPDGPGGNSSIQAYCDMDTGGGGWILVWHGLPTQSRYLLTDGQRVNLGNNIVFNEIRVVGVNLDFGVTDTTSETAVLKKTIPEYFKDVADEPDGSDPRVNFHDVSGNKDVTLSNNYFFRGYGNDWRIFYTCVNVGSDPQGDYMYLGGYSPSCTPRSSFDAADVGCSGSGSNYCQDSLDWTPVDSGLGLSKREYQEAKVWVRESSAGTRLTSGAVNKSGAYALAISNITVTGEINGNTISSDASSGWTHVVMTYDKDAGSDQQKLYINGALAAQGTLSDPINMNSDNLTIGKNFTGILDEVAIWNRALSASEVSSLYKMGHAKLNMTEYVSNGGTRDPWTNYTVKVRKAGTLGVGKGKFNFSSSKTINITVPDANATYNEAEKTINITGANNTCESLYDEIFNETLVKQLATTGHFTRHLNISASLNVTNASTFYVDHCRLKMGIDRDSEFNITSYGNLSITGYSHIESDTGGLGNDYRIYAAPNSNLTIYNSIVEDSGHEWHTDRMFTTETTDTYIDNITLKDGYGIKLDAQWINISNVKCESSHYCMYTEGCDHCIIENVTATGGAYGALVYEDYMTLRNFLTDGTDNGLYWASDVQGTVANNITVRSADYGLRLYGFAGTGNRIIDSSFDGSAADVYVSDNWDAPASIALLNCTYDESEVTWESDATGEFQRQWYVDFNLTKAVDGGAICNMNISLYNSTGDYATYGMTTCNYTNALNPRGMVAYWPMNDNKIGSGQIIEDKIGSNDGTISGDLNCTTTGYLKKGCKFDATSKYINAGNVDNAINGNFTWAAWVYPVNIPASTGSPIIAKMAVFESGAHFGIDTAEGGSELVLMDWKDISTCEGVTQLEANNWYHTVAMYNGTDVSIYLNGKHEKSCPMTVTPDTTTDLYIGFAGSVYFNGTIDEVGIWNRALEPGEVDRIYKAGWARLNVTEYVQKQAGRTYWTNYTAHINKSGYLSNSTEFNFSGNGKIINISITMGGSVANPTLTSANGENTTNQDLRCYTRVFDPEDDPLNVTVRWYNGSQLAFAYEYNGSYTLETDFTGVLDSNHTFVGSTWKCSVGIDDGTSQYWLNSSTLTIVPYDTSLSAFDQESDEEDESQSQDTVYVNQWTKFYADYTNSTGDKIAQVMHRVGDIGTGHSVAAVDKDGDGVNDDFVYSEYDDIYAYSFDATSAGDYEWRTSKSNFDYSFDNIAVGDFDNDGDTEIATIGSYGPGCLNILNLSNGVLEHQFCGHEYTYYSFAYGDIDDDGRKDDFVFGSRDVSGMDNEYGIVVWGYNETSGQYENFWNATEPRNWIYGLQISEIPDGPNLIGVADGGGYRIYVYYGENGTLKFETSSLGYYTWDLEFIDQDSDGREDELAVGRHGYVYVLNDDGSTNWTDSAPYGYEYELEKFDFDGDGIYDDILVGSNYHTLDAYSSDGTKQWRFTAPAKEFEDVFGSNYFTAIRFGDINNDNKLEIIVGGFSNRYWILNSTNGEVIDKFWYGYESDIGESYIGKNTGDSPGLHVIGDINGDGINDILAARNTGYVYQNQQASCKITINGTEDYMYYNYDDDLWEYDHFFNETDFNFKTGDSVTFNWSVTCSKGGYVTQSSGTKNITVHVKNSTAEFYDQEDDDEDKSAWVSEMPIAENQQTYFFANYTDLLSGEPADNLTLELEWVTDIGNTYDAAGMDLDGDGEKEAFVFGEYDDVYAYYINGTQAWRYSNGIYDSVRAVETHDFNNDSLMEVAALANRGYLFILNSTGDEIYRSDDYGSCYNMMAGDITGDGLWEIAISCNSVGSGGYGIAVFRYNPDYDTFEEYWTATDATWYVTEIKLSEIDGGQNLVGFSDGSGQEKVYVYYGDGTKAWETTDVGSSCYSFTFFDYDSDGKEDEVAAGEIGDVFIFDSNGQIRTNTNPVDYVYEMEPFDYYQDGIRNEYLIFEEHYLRLYRYYSSEIWSQRVENCQYGSLYVHDINNDGEDEIILGCRDAVIYIYNRTGSLLYRLNYLLPGEFSGTEFPRMGETIYGTQGLGFTDANNDVYMALAANDAYIGSIKSYPNCRIGFSDEDEYKRMNYNISAGLYYYNRTFSAEGDYTWNATCESMRHTTKSSA